jgi:hypothetical protein
MIRGILLVFGALLALAGCYETYPTDAVEQRLELRVDADSLPADGATLVRVAASIPRDARRDARSVSFTANGGTFVDGGTGSVSLTAVDGIAETYLRAPRTPGSVRIRAQLGTIIRDTTIVFHAALPTRADVQPPGFVIKGSLASQVTITAHLRRAIGLPTPGTEVTFQAVREDNLQPIGRFGVALPSDANGLVTVPYSTGDTDYRGPVRIRVLTTTGRLLGETTINVIAPG